MDRRTRGDRHVMRAQIDRMASFPAGLRALVGSLTDGDARWKPASGAWSILEIVRHLGDEEVDDFRSRLRSTLDDPSRPWPPIDPEAWARTRRYNEASLGEALARFEHERGASVAWLRTLGEIDLSIVHQHARIGPLRAGDLLASWAAHDALHLRQIAKRLFELASRDNPGFQTEYAGQW